MKTPLFRGRSWRTPSQGEGRRKVVDGVRPLVVVGVGGFGRETLDVIEAINLRQARYRVLGAVDDAPSDKNLARLDSRQITYLGSVGLWLSMRPNAEVLVAIGDPVARRRVVERIAAAGLEFATAIHPSAIIGSRATIGEGSVICAGAVISTNVTLGHHVHVNANATVGHDSNLGDFVSINPSATISGEVHVGSATLVGAAACVLQRIHVGHGSTIGAVACVTKDVPNGVVVMGVPAR